MYESIEIRAERASDDFDSPTRRAADNVLARAHSRFRIERQSNVSSFVVSLSLSLSFTPVSLTSFYETQISYKVSLASLNLAIVTDDMQLLALRVDSRVSFNLPLEREDTGKLNPPRRVRRLKIQVTRTRTPNGDSCDEPCRRIELSAVLTICVNVRARRRMCTRVKSARA